MSLDLLTSPTDDAVVDGSGDLLARDVAGPRRASPVPSRRSTSRPSATTRSTWWCAPAASRSASRASRCASARCIDATLALPGYHGILAFTLPEALWLAETHDDVVLGYPTRRPRGDRRARRRRARRRAGDPHGRRPRAARPRRRRRRARHAVPRSASRSTRTPRGALPALGHIGVRRSPVHDPAEVANLARAIAARPGFRLVGLMMYEAQIAGQGDATGSGDARDPLDAAPLRQRAARAPRARSSPRCATSPRSSSSTAAAPARSSCTASDQAVTELDRRQRPARRPPVRRLPRVRSRRPPRRSRSRSCASPRPTSRPCSAAAGSPRARRSPRASRCPSGRQGLKTLGREGAGEVQTPLQGEAARGAAGRRPRVVPPLQERRARRARRPLSPGRRRRDRRRDAHLPRRREGVPVTTTGRHVAELGPLGVGAPAARRVPAHRSRRCSARCVAAAAQRHARQGGRRRAQLHRHRRRARRAARPRPTCRARRASTASGRA